MLLPAVESRHEAAVKTSPAIPAIARFLQTIAASFALRRQAFIAQAQLSAMGYFFVGAGFHIAKYAPVGSWMTLIQP